MIKTQSRQNQMPQPDYLPSYLTDQQLEAILHRGSPLLIIAGQQGRPGAQGPYPVQAAPSQRGADVGLDHPRLLRRPAAPLPPTFPPPHGFHILDEAGQFLFVYAHRRDLGLNEVVKGRPQDFFASVQHTFNLATEELVDPADLQAWCEENEACCCADETELWHERAIVAEAYRRYCDLLEEEEIAFYEGRHDDLIYEAPAFYRLLTRLLDDPLLPNQLRPLVVAAVAYFILPADIIPEEIHGPYGYVDDIFLCALTAQHILETVGDDTILVENWDGEGPVIPLIRDILDRESDLIGDQRERILWYIGYEHLTFEGAT